MGMGNTHLLRGWALSVGSESVSTNEVHHNQMEDSVSKQEVSEGSLWRDRQEVSLVLWVDLDTKTH